MLAVMYGSMTFSRVLAIGDNSAIGLYEVPNDGFLFGLGMGIILAFFQLFGMMFWLMAMLYMCVSRSIAVCPRCFRCLMFMSSGPVELLLRDCLMASVT